MARRSEDLSLPVLLRQLLQTAMHVISNEFHLSSHSSSNHSLARSTSNKSRVHRRMSSFRMSSISSASHLISSSPSKGLDIGSNSVGSNGSVSRAVSRYWASCHRSKFVLILSTSVEDRVYHSRSNRETDGLKITGLLQSYQSFLDRQTNAAKSSSNSRHDRVIGIQLAPATPIF